jgi:hypothetical protein
MKKLTALGLAISALTINGNVQAASFASSYINVSGLGFYDSPGSNTLISGDNFKTTGSDNTGQSLGIANSGNTSASVGGTPPDKTDFSGTVTGSFNLYANPTNTGYAKDAYTNYGPTGSAVPPVPGTFSAGQSQLAGAALDFGGNSAAHAQTYGAASLVGPGTGGTQSNTDTDSLVWFSAIKDVNSTFKFDYSDWYNVFSSDPLASAHAKGSLAISLFDITDKISIFSLTINLGNGDGTAFTARNSQDVNAYNNSYSYAADFIADHTYEFKANATNDTQVFSEEAGVPEPASLALLSIGLFGIAATNHRMRNKT